jgi:GNAT superfamily N-acetyltransferase
MTRIIRPAQFQDIDSLNVLIQASAVELSKLDYSSAEINGLMKYVFGVDTELVEDQSYFVIVEGDVPIACGGWSRRRTLFGSDACEARESGYLDPGKDAAKIRAFFVHPDYARQGLAKWLMDTCENEAKKFGFHKTELMSTLPGIKFYESQGYKGENLIDYTLPSGLKVRFLPMSKVLS